MDVSRRTVLRGSAVVGLGAAIPVIRAPASSASTARNPLPVTYPVTVGGAKTKITGRLHLPGRPARGLIIGIPGMTYAGYYWDFPHPGNNFATALTDAGWAVLALNLPGTELSTGYPDPALLTIANEAAAVSQVVQAIRKEWRPIILAGHSVGSSIVLEAAASSGADALILSGFTHTISAAGQALAQQGVIAAPGLPDGYITTTDASRAGVFLQTGVSPEVIALDAKLKTDGSVTELITLASSFDPAFSRPLGLPVLIANGEFDLLYYGPGVTGTVAGTIASEAPFWTRQPSVFVLPGAPHCLSLARNADSWFRAAARFANQIQR